MIIRNVPLEVLQSVRLDGVRAEINQINGKAIRVRLLLSHDDKRETYRKVDAYDERKGGLNWFGFRDWLAILFSVAPNARVDAGLQFAVRYDGVEEFVARFPATGRINVGTVCYPQQPIEQVDMDMYGRYTSDERVIEDLRASLRLAA